MVMRFIGEELVYDSSWAGTCCKLGHAIRESYSMKNSIKNIPVYRITANQKAIIKDFCCPSCYKTIRNEPNVFSTLKQALNTLHSLKSHHNY